VSYVICLQLFRLNFSAPIAQLDRAPDYGSGGWGFESLWVHHYKSLGDNKL
jgi:hypothetical protein